MTKAGQVTVGLGLDATKYFEAINKAEKKSEELEKVWRENGKALDKMRVEMEKSENPTEKMVENFNKLVDKTEKSKKAFEDSAKEAKKIKEEFNRLKEETEQLNSPLGKLKSAFDGMNGSFKAFGVGLAGTVAGQLVMKSIGTIRDLGRYALETSAAFEDLSMQFKVMAGENAGQELLNQITQLANKTPMTTQALANAAQTMLSFGESANNIIGDLRMIGDIAAGDENKFQSLVLAFSQIGSTGRLTGQDLLQLINAGFNPLQIMSEKTGKSMAQLKEEMAKGKITFDDVKNAMISATSEGGKFFKMMDKQSDTLNGRLSTMRDTWAQVSKQIGDVFLPVAKGAVSMLTALGNGILDLTQKMKNFADKVTYNSESGQMKLAERYKKQAEAFNELSASYEKRGNTYYAKNYKEQSEKYLAASEQALKKAKEIKDKIQAIETTPTNKGFGGTNTAGVTAGATKTTKTKSTSSSSSSSSNPAIDEYKAFVEQYKQVTRDYEATLQARNYVEKTLGISANSEDYQSALGVYKDYFLKRKEIELSSAKDKASLLKMEETKLQQDLQLIALQKTDETQRKQWELIKGYQQKMADMQLNEQAYQNAGGFFASFGASFNEKLAIEKNYLAERAKIEQMSFTSLQEQQDAYNQLELLKTQQYNQLKVDNWRKMGTDIEGILQNSFSSMLTNYGNFSDNMKQLALNLIQYIIKQLMQLMVTSQAVKGVLNSLSGGFGGFGGFLSGLFKHHSGHTVIKRHSGGLEMPDQTEHFALLKNNERVLSPSETSAYNQGNGGSQGGGYVVYAPQVKAMNSKDVAQWFNENKNQVIAIVSEGIKNNKQGLRTMVQNA